MTGRRTAEAADDAQSTLRAEGDEVRALRDLGRGGPDDEAAPRREVAAADLEALLDALRLAGRPRGAPWLLQFLRALGTPTARGTPWTAADVDSVIDRLTEARRLVTARGIGWDVPPGDRDAAWPRLALRPDIAQAWSAWATASVPYAAPGLAPPVPAYQDQADARAYARLVLLGGLDLAAFRRLQARSMGLAGQDEVLAEALLMPFVPALVERLDPALREALLARFVERFAMDTPPWQPLLAWVDARLAAGRNVSAALRFVIAQRRLDLGDLPGSEAAVAGLETPGVPLLAAARIAWAGRWADAAAAFREALKQAAKLARTKRRLAPPALMRWYLLSLLAQPEPTAWAEAHKVAVAESGLRQPPPGSPWGLWAHAAATKLGDVALDADAFAWPRAPHERADLGAMAWRLVLAAWLGHAPAGWGPDEGAFVVAAARRAGKPWLADLVRQAAQRLGWTAPARAPDDLPPWPAAFYGRPQEPWREALAAIEALGTARPGADGLDAPPPLHWRLTLDDEHRVLDVVPFDPPSAEPATGRGRGRARSLPKPVPLSRVRKSTRLDPRDAAVARCIEAGRWTPGQMAIDVVGATLALAGHPSVAFDDAPDQPVDLREALPVLEVQRQQGEDGRPCYAFHLADPLLAAEPPEVGNRFTSTDTSTERERRNSLRVMRDAPDRARLIRISAAQRRVAELIAKRWTVPADAQDELAGALRVLAGHFQLHSDAEAGVAVQAVSRLRAQLRPLGEALQLRLVVQPFGDFGPSVVPGRGRARLIALHQQRSLTTERDLAAERAHLSAVREALPFLGSDDDGEATWTLDDPEQALTAVERLPRLPEIASLDWPRGKPVRVIAAPAGAVQVQLARAGDWFALDGQLQVDEQRVLGLQQLMQLSNGSRTGRFVALGDGEYLALTERLRRQLADLEAAALAQKDGLKLPAAAAAWLAETMDGVGVQGDADWQARLQRLDEAAALQPVPPPGLQAELRAYQAEGHAWMRRLAHAGLGACLADDMGLGKTLQTLALLLDRAADGPALVLAPTSVCSNWIDEVARHAPGLRARLVTDNAKRERLAEAGPGDVIVASYARAQIDADVFGKVAWATLVLDEAQALKNAQTKRAKSVATFQAGFRLALTGTPVENRLADLWSIMNILNPGLLGTQAQFNERCVAPIEREHDDAARQRLRRLVSPFLLRRTKAQVLADLPPRTEVIHRVQPGDDERAFLEAMRRRALDRIAHLDDAATAGSGGAFHVLAELTRLRRAACDPRLVEPGLALVGAKVQEFERLATELVAARHKALVFSQFTDFLALLGERLDAAGIAYQHLDGSTPAAERGERVAAFQRGEGDLFLISLKAGGFGLNLTAADYVLIVDPWWNPAAEDQAMGRAHRLGQLRPVTVYRLVTAGSIEERIVELHRDKRALADGLLEGHDSAAPLDPAALRALLDEAAAPPPSS